MELFDEVDKNDNVIGVTNKEEAHALGLLHRVVAVYVFNSSGQLYVQMHKKSGLLDHSIGGHVSKGEGYDEGARREAKEELGITQSLTKLSIFYSDEGRMQHMFGLYECIADASWHFTPNDEVDEIIPMKLAEICAMMDREPSKFTGGFINTMKEYLKASQ